MSQGTQQPIAIEVLPTPDRATVIILLRSDAPIPMMTLIESLKRFTVSLEDKFIENQSKIRKPPTPKLILPGQE